MKLINTYNKLSEGWYSWTASIDGTEEEINKINQVTYILHKSFPQRRIVSTNPSNNFSRTMDGWGEFLLKAEVEMKTGEKLTAELWLDLGLADTETAKSQYTGEFFSTEQVGTGEKPPGF
jgi:transcription initiation factor IIF auxiliary subunit